jgi:hypothetical protein
MLAEWLLIIPSKSGLKPFCSIVHKKNINPIPFSCPRGMIMEVLLEIVYSGINKRGFSVLGK